MKSDFLNPRKALGFVLWLILITGADLLFRYFFLTQKFLEEALWFSILKAMGFALIILIAAIFVLRQQEKNEE